jgi:hypothetical protein
MNYYLVNCIITISHYMSSQEHVERFYHDKSDSYGTSYSCCAYVEEIVE